MKLTATPLLLLPLLAACAGPAGTLEPAEVGTLARVHTFGDLYLTSQPQPADLELLEQAGLETVIDQRHAAERPEFDERAFANSLGLAYHNPAFGRPDELTDAVIDETIALLEIVDRPALMHCASANRTGAIWLAYRTTVDGLAWEAALAEAKAVGLRSPDYERIVQEYVDRRSNR